MRSRSADVFVDITRMEDTLAMARVPARVGAWVTASFAIVAMSLAALGVYGLVAFSVAQRTREMCVRKAVGAGAMDLVRLIVGENMLLAAGGLVGGTLLGVLGGTILRTFIVGVSPMDALTLAATAALVCGAALTASAIPAARAARLNPMVVLRDV
jgi:ABC-type antimicrobial peptide transport system permease subunit